MPPRLVYVQRAGAPNEAFVERGAAHRPAVLKQLDCPRHWFGTGILEKAEKTHRIDLRVRGLSVSDSFYAVSPQW